VARILAQGENAAGAEFGGGEMKVGELGYGVPDAFVDRARHLAALGVGQGDVHVGGGDGGRHRLEAVGDGHDDVGFEHLEGGRQLEQAETGGPGHRRRRLSLDDERDLHVRLEAGLLESPHRSAEALEESRRRRDHLQVERRMISDRLEDGGDPSQVGPAGHDDADLPAVRHGAHLHGWEASGAHRGRLVGQGTRYSSCISHSPHVIVNTFTIALRQS